MNDLPFLTAVDFSFSVPPVPWHEPEFYVREITGTIRCMISETEEVVAGTIKILRLAAVEAFNHKVALYDVCDAHSDFLSAAYSAVFDENEEPKEDLDIEPSWHDIIVLWEFDVKPEFRSSGAVIKSFETAIAAFGSQGLIVTARGEESSDFIGLDLTVDEWRELGFYKISQSHFVFRDNCALNPYRKQKPGEGTE
jgi:hypothetical protein